MPQLKEHNVRLIGVGLETLGMEVCTKSDFADMIITQEFVEGEFFAGELYVDEAKASFQQLGFKRLVGL